jgi:hypothetical protein
MSERAFSLHHHFSRASGEKPGNPYRGGGFLPNLYSADSPFSKTLIVDFLAFRCRNTYLEFAMDFAYLAGFGVFFILVLGMAAGCARLGGPQ